MKKLRLKQTSKLLAMTEKEGVKTAVIAVDASLGDFITQDHREVKLPQADFVVKVGETYNFTLEISAYDFNLAVKCVAVSKLDRLEK